MTENKKWKKKLSVSWQNKISFFHKKFTIVFKYSNKDMSTCQKVILPKISTVSVCWKLLWRDCRHFSNALATLCWLKKTFQLSFIASFFAAHFLLLLTFNKSFVKQRGVSLIYLLDRDVHFIIASVNWSDHIK